MKKTPVIFVVCLAVPSAALAGDYSAFHSASGRIQDGSLLNVPVFASTPFAAGTVTIGVSVKADLAGANKGVDLLFNSATGYAGHNNLLFNSALSCTAVYQTTVTATAAQWNAQRDSGGNVTLGVFGGVGSVALCQTSLCQNDPTHDYVCLNPGPGQTLLSEFVQIAVSYSVFGCYPACGSGQQCCSGDVCRECCSASDCNDDAVCTTDFCVDGVCLNADNTNACDDGLFCTLTDVCSGGACVGSGNSCTGGLICNEVDEACTSCTSASQCSDGNPCTLDQCAGGLCQNTSVSDGTACSDDLYCTGADTCISGVCNHPGSPCEQGSTCDETTDSCRQACTSPTQCNDGNPCTVDACTGGFCAYSNALSTVTCQDDLFCSSGGQCLAGKCVGYASTCSDPIEVPDIPNNPLCNELLNTCDTTNLPCAGETRSTGFLTGFGRDCPKSFTFSNVPHVASPVLVRTYAQGQYATYGGGYHVDLQGIGRVATDLNRNHTQNCLSGTSINWYFEISPEQWNQAVDHDGGNGIGNVRFDFSSDNTGCSDCGGGVNGRVVLDVTYLDEALDRNLNGIDDFCDFDYNDDGCVDLRDFATFQNDFTGTLLNDLYAYQLFLGVFTGPCGDEGFQMLQSGGPEAGGNAAPALLSENTAAQESTVQLESTLQPEPTEEEIFQSIRDDYLELLSIEWNDGLSEPMIAFIVLSPAFADSLPDDVRKELAAELGSRLEQCENETSCKDFPDPATRALVPTVMTLLMNAGTCDSAGFTA